MRQKFLICFFTITQFVFSQTGANQRNASATMDVKSHDNLPSLILRNMDNEEVLRVAPTGNIGIGVDSPDSKLDVRGGNVYFDGVTKMGGSVNRITNASAQLELSDQDKGFLPNRLPLISLTQKSPVTDAVDGMFVYNTTSDANKNLFPDYYVWRSNRWHRIITDNDNALKKPWLVQEKFTEATSNDEDIFQMGSVGIGSEAVVLPYKFQVTGNSNITGNETIRGTLTVDKQSTLMGNVGIGITPPTQALDVNGKVRVRTLDTPPNNNSNRMNSLFATSQGVISAGGSGYTRLAGGYRPGKNYVITTLRNVENNLTQIRFVIQINANPENYLYNSNYSAYAFGDFTIVGLPNAPAKIVQANIYGHNGKLMKDIPNTKYDQTDNTISWTLRQPPYPDLGTVKIVLDHETRQLKLESNDLFSYVFEISGNF